MVDLGPAVDAQCPSYAVALGYAGVAAAVCLSNWGSAVSSRSRKDFRFVYSTVAIHHFHDRSKIEEEVREKYSVMSILQRGREENTR